MMYNNNNVNQNKEIITYNGEIMSYKRYRLERMLEKGEIDLTEFKELMKKAEEEEQ